MRLHKVVIRQIKADCSFEVFELFGKRIREAGKATAVHPKGVILLFDVRRANQSFARRTHDIGHPDLRRLVHQEMGMMDAFEDGEWNRFKARVDEKYPKFGATMMLPLGA